METLQPTSTSGNSQKPRQGLTRPIGAPPNDLYLLPYRIHNTTNTRHTPYQTHAQNHTRPTTRTQQTLTHATITKEAEERRRNEGKYTNTDSLPGSRSNKITTHTTTTTKAMQQHVTSITEALRTTYSENMTNFRTNASLLENTNGKIDQTQQDIKALTDKLHTLEYQLERTTNTANTNHETHTQTEAYQRTNVHTYSGSGKQTTENTHTDLHTTDLPTSKRRRGNHTFITPPRHRHRQLSHTTSRRQIQRFDQLRHTTRAGSTQDNLTTPQHYTTTDSESTTRT